MAFFLRLLWPSFWDVTADVVLFILISFIGWFWRRTYQRCRDLYIFIGLVGKRRGLYLCKNQWTCTCIVFNRLWYSDPVNYLFFIRSMVFSIDCSREPSSIWTLFFIILHLSYILLYMCCLRDLYTLYKSTCSFHFP